MKNCDCTKANKSVECSVTQCKYHCVTQPYCALEKIMVGTHEANPSMQQCTDCMSFEMKM